MSLEAKIDTLTAAVEALTKVMEGGMSAKTTAASSKDTEKGTEEKKPATRRTSTKTKAPTVADMKKAAESFLDKSNGDDDNYNERRQHIKTIIKKYDAPKFTEIGEDDRQAAIDLLADFDKEDGGSTSRDEDDDI